LTPEPAEPGAAPSDPVLRAMLEASGVWLWDCDLEQDLSSYQDGFWEQYGYDRSRFAETFDFIQVVHRADLGAVTNAWRAHVEGETEIYAAEWRLLTAAGEWRWIRSRGRVISRDASGRALRMAGTYTDITDLKQLEAAWAERCAELDSVFANSHDGLALIAPDLTILRANAAAAGIIERLTGFRLSEGQSILDIPAVTAERLLVNDIKRALAGAPAIPERLFGAPAAGLWVETSCSPVYHDDGTILGAAVSLRDVTERKQLELTRLQTVRLESMGLLASGVAHDFNNLLAAIIGNIDLAALEADEAVRPMLADAKEAARRASELVKELLSFAAGQAPGAEARDLAKLVHEIVRYARMIPGQTASVVEEHDAPLPPVQVDATRIRQVILNLVVNALDATRESGGTVRVRTFRVGRPAQVQGELAAEPRPAREYVVLQVADDGPGIERETLARIWDPFFTTKPSGHGLGLPSVLSAVTSHGGTVSVHSEPGKGATFNVFLPVD